MFYFICYHCVKRTVNWNYNRLNKVNFISVSSIAYCVQNSGFDARFLENGKVWDVAQGTIDAILMAT